MKLSIKARVISILSLSLSLVTTASSADSVRLGSKPLSRIVIPADTLFPEGIDYNPKSDRFVVSSFRQGAVYEVDHEGNYQKIIHDSRLSSVLAVRIDSKNNRLLLANSDIGSSIRPYPDGPGKLAALGIYNLTSGAPIAYVDLGQLLPSSAHLANGIAVDHDGNAYVTDSFSPVIYKVDMDGTPSIFLKNDAFIGEGINLNGIVFHPDGYLIVVKKGEGVLYKIPIDTPENFSKVDIDQKLVGGDGLILANNHELIVVANRASGKTIETAFSLSSYDNWRTAQITDQYRFDHVYPTTGVIQDGNIFVIHSRLNTLIMAPEPKKKNIHHHAVIQQIGTIDP